VAENLGAGEARLRQLNQRLIYCALSGFDPQAQHLQRFVDAPHPEHAQGERALDVTAPPLLGDHNGVLRSGASPWRRARSE
jgi:hypothetical protein